MTTYTLSEFTELIKYTLTESFPDSYWITAEIARINVNQKGHCYLELVEKKAESSDPVARINANIWAYSFRNLSAKFTKVTRETLKPGMQVLILVTVQFHEVYGLSLNVQDIDPTYSLGEMARKKKEVLERLKKEGLIELNKGLPLPLVPQRIAIVSSPTAAGYEDFINHLDTNPYRYRFITDLFPALMQGEEAEWSIISSLSDIEARKDLFDVAVVIRGGGSQVDLSCFDSYDLASKVALFSLPVIAGIGHERDETIVDAVAHTRLKTPTAVAEFIISGVRVFEERMIDSQRRLITTAERMIRDREHTLKMQSKIMVHSVQSYLTEKRQSFKSLTLNLGYKPAQILASQRHRLDVAISEIGCLTIKTVTDSQKRVLELVKGLKVYMRQSLQLQDNRLKNIEQVLRLLDPMNVLKRGYTMTFANGKALRGIEHIKKGDKIETRLYKGKITSRVDSLKDIKDV